MDLWLYVYGNGDFIYEILTSVNFFMNNAKSFFELAAMLSLIIFAFEATGTIPSRGYDWTKFIKIYVILGIFVMTPYPGAVNVHDVITNQDRTFNFRDGKLPFGMIAPIALTSTVIYRTIMLYQQNFEIDENLNYTYSGMNFGANFIQSLDNVSSYDPNFDFNLDMYMQNCGFPLISKAGALSELRRSTDIFSTLKKYTSASRYVQQTDYVRGVGTFVVPCSQAINDLDQYFENHKDQILQRNAEMIGVSTANGLDRYKMSAEASAVTLLNISQGAAAAMKQAIGMNVMMASLKSGALAVGNGSLALAAYDAEQFQQYKTTSALSGAASARTIPVLVGIGFALLFLLYPIIIFMAVAMGSYKGIGVFFQILVGINLIPLIYEVLNFITTFYLQKKLGTVITGQGFSYEVSTSLYSFTDNMIVAGNYLATATPLIAYAIVSGSAMALTSVFDHINDPAKNQANNVGTEMARGNQSIGNASIDTSSYNNLNSNKLDNQMSMSTGAPMIKTASAGGNETNIGGKSYANNYKNDLLVTPTITEAATTQLQNSLSHSQNDMSQISKQWGNTATRLNELSNSISSGQSNTNSIGTDEAKNIRHAQELATRIQAQASVGGKVFGTGLGVDGSINSGAVADFNKNVSEYNRYANELSNSSNQAVREAFSNSSSLTTSTMNTAQDIVSKSEQLSYIKSNTSNINSNFSNDFADYIRSHGLNPNDLNATQQQALANQFVSETLNSPNGIKNLLNEPTSSVSKFNHPDSPSSNGLQLPSDGSQMAVDTNKQRAKVNEEIKDFQENSGNIIGNQIIEQGKTAGNVVSNSAEKIGGLMYDVAHPERSNNHKNNNIKQPKNTKNNDMPDV